MSYYRNIFGIVLYLIGLSFCGCDSAINNGDESNPIEGQYIVKTIKDVTVDIYAERYTEYPNFDWPLIIELDNSPSDSIFSGQVKLAKLGWVEIVGNCNKPPYNCFTLDIKGLLGPVESVLFTELDYDNSSMIGVFYHLGPTIDTGPLPFTALVE